MISTPRLQFIISIMMHGLCDVNAASQVSCKHDLLAIQGLEDVLVGI